MKPLIVLSDVTVDGFMTGPDNDLDFMVDDPGLGDELTGELMSVADTIVVGRKTFPDMAARWTTADGDLAAWMNATPKVVLSTDGSFDVGAWEISTLATGDGPEQVRRLKASSGRALVTFGGVRTVSSLVVADLVDEYWLKFNPAISGHLADVNVSIDGRRGVKNRGWTRRHENRNHRADQHLRHPIPKDGADTDVVLPVAESGVKRSPTKGETKWTVGAGNWMSSPRIGPRPSWAATPPRSRRSWPTISSGSDRAASRSPKSSGSSATSQEA